VENREGSFEHSFWLFYDYRKIHIETTNLKMRIQEKEKQRERERERKRERKRERG